MNSTRHKPRGWSDQKFAQDYGLRKAVRSFLRNNFPHLDPPYGGDWLYIVMDRRCRRCSNRLIAVQIRGFNMPYLCYCGVCDVALFDRPTAK